MTDWKPIESAPKDGTVILAWRFFPVAIMWTEDKDFPWKAVHLGGCSALSDNGFIDEDISLKYWMPLPEKPKE